MRRPFATLHFQFILVPKVAALGDAAAVFQPRLDFL
jgi:hypothetical protein